MNRSYLGLKKVNIFDLLVAAGLIYNIFNIHSSLTRYGKCIRADDKHGFVAPLRDLLIQKIILQTNESLGLKSLFCVNNASIQQKHTPQKPIHPLFSLQNSALTL